MKMMLLTAAGGLALLMAGCGSETGSQGDIQASALKLYVLDCGQLQVSDLGVFASDGSYAGQSGPLADTCYLVRHPEGDLLWDLGLPASLVEEGPQTNEPFTVSMERSLKDQLADLGVGEGDIEYVAISHYHFDHTSQPEAAAGATWITQQAEYDAMFGENPPGDYAAFKSFETEMINGDHDLFGDGSVKMISLPGHTPGHMALLVDLPKAGPVLLSGDLYHRIPSREGRKIPVFNTDADQTLASMEKFEALAEETGARVIIQHSAEHVAALPKPPEAME